MIMKSIKSGIIVFILLLSMVSCKRDYTDKGYIGPAVRQASAKFTATGFSVQGPCDFSTASNYPSFNVTMNEDVSWTIVLTGQRSGATKTITRTSQGFGGVYPNDAIWDGSHDGINYFETGEIVSAVLTVAGWNSSLSTTFTLNGAQVWSNSIIPCHLATVSTDFESKTGNDSVWVGNGAPTMFDLQTKPATLSFRYIPGEWPLANLIKQNSTFQAPEGQYFCRAQGSFNNFTASANGVFIDGVQCRTNWGTNQNKMIQGYNFPDLDPTKIYLCTRN